MSWPREWPTPFLEFIKGEQWDSRLSPWCCRHPPHGPSGLTTLLISSCQVQAGPPGSTWFSWTPIPGLLVFIWHLLSSRCMLPRMLVPLVRGSYGINSSSLIIFIVGGGKMVLIFFLFFFLVFNLIFYLILTAWFDKNRVFHLHMTFAAEEVVKCF